MQSVALNAAQAKELASFIAISNDNGNKTRPDVYNAFTKKSGAIYSTNGRALIKKDCPVYIGMLDDGVYTLDGAMVLQKDVRPRDVERVVPNTSCLTRSSAKVNQGTIVSVLSMLSKKTYNVEALGFKHIYKLMGKETQDVEFGWSDRLPSVMAIPGAGLLVVCMPCNVVFNSMPEEAEAV